MEDVLLLSDPSVLPTLATPSCVPPSQPSSSWGNTRDIAPRGQRWYRWWFIHVDRISDHFRVSANFHSLCSVWLVSYASVFLRDSFLHPVVTRYFLLMKPMASRWTLWLASYLISVWWLGKAEHLKSYQKETLLCFFFLTDLYIVQ